MTSSARHPALHALAAALGCLAGLMPLYVGTTTQGAGWRGVLAALTGGLLLCLLLLAGARLFPRLAPWFRAGVTGLAAASVTSVAVLAVGVAILWSNFDTEYAPGYSERAFDRIEIGDSHESVLAALGEPLSSRPSKPYVRWIYSADDQRSFARDGSRRGTYTEFWFRPEGRLEFVTGQTSTSPGIVLFGNGANHLGLRDEEIRALDGASTGQIRDRFGAPRAIYEYRATTVLSYSRSPSSGNFHLRQVGLDSRGRVVHILRSVYFD